MAHGRNMKGLAFGLIALTILLLLHNEAECAKKKKKSTISSLKKKNKHDAEKKHHDIPADKRGLVPDYMQGAGAGGYMDGGGGMYPSRETVKRSAVGNSTKIKHLTPPLHPSNTTHNKHSKNATRRSGGPWNVTIPEDYESSLTAINSLNAASNKGSLPDLRPQRITLNNISKIDEDLEGLTSAKEAAGYNGEFEGIPAKELMDEAKISDETAVFSDETKNNAPLTTSMQMDKMINDHILQRTALENMMLTSSTDAGAKTLNNYDINKGSFDINKGNYAMNKGSFAKQDEKEEGSKSIFTNIKNRLDQLSDNTEYNIAKGGDLLQPVSIPVGGTHVPGREGVSSVAGIFKQNPVSNGSMDDTFTPDDISDADDSTLAKWSSQGDDMGTINGLNGYDTAGNTDVGGLGQSGGAGGGAGGGGDSVGGSEKAMLTTSPSKSQKPIDNSVTVPNMNEARLEGLKMQPHVAKNKTACVNCRTKVGNKSVTHAQKQQPIIKHHTNSTVTVSNNTRLDNETSSNSTSNNSTIDTSMVGNYTDEKNLNETDGNNHTQFFNDEVDFLANVIMNDMDRVKLKTRTKTDNKPTNSSEQPVVVKNITTKNSNDCVKIAPMDKITLPYECAVDIVKSKNDTDDEICPDGQTKKKDTVCQSDSRKANNVKSSENSANDTAVNGTDASLLVSINVSDDENVPFDDQKSVNGTMKLFIPNDKSLSEHARDSKSDSNSDSLKRHNLTASHDLIHTQTLSNSSKISDVRIKSLLSKINRSLTFDDLVNIDPEQDDISPADIAKELQQIEVSFIKNPSSHHHRHRSHFRDEDGVDKREGRRFNRMNNMLKNNLMQRVALERAMMTNNISSIQRAALEHEMMDHHIIPDLSILTENDINVAGRDSVHEDEEEDRYSQFQEKIDHLLDQVRSSAFSRKHILRIKGADTAQRKKHGPSGPSLDGKSKSKSSKLSKAVSNRKRTEENLSQNIVVNEAKLNGPSLTSSRNPPTVEDVLNEEARKKEIIIKDLERTNDIIDLLSQEEEQAPAFTRNKIKNFTFSKSDEEERGERRENLTKEERLKNSLHAAFNDYINELRKEVTDKKIEKKVYSYLNLDNTLEGRSDWEIDEVKDERDKLMNETQENLKATQRNLDRIHENMKHAHANMNSTEVNMVGSEITTKAIKDTVESTLKSKGVEIENDVGDVETGDVKTDVAKNVSDDAAASNNNTKDISEGVKHSDATNSVENQTKTLQGNNKESGKEQTVTVNVDKDKMGSNSSSNSTKSISTISNNKVTNKSISSGASFVKPPGRLLKYHMFTNTSSDSTPNDIFPDTKQSFAVMNNRPHVVSVDITPDDELAGKRSKPFNSSKALLDILDLNEALTGIIKVVRKSGKNFTPNKMHLIKSILRSMNHFYSEIERENNIQNDARTLNKNSTNQNVTNVNETNNNGDDEEVAPRNRTNIEIRGILKSSIFNGNQGEGMSEIKGGALKFEQMDRMIQNHLLQRAALENEMTSGNIIPDVTTLNDYDLNMRRPNGQQRSGFQEQPSKIQEKLDYLLDHALYPMTQRKGDIEANDKKDGVNEHNPRVFFISHNATKRTLDNIMKLNKEILKDISKPANKKSDLSNDFTNFTHKLQNSFHMPEKMKSLKNNVADKFSSGRKTLQSKMAAGKKTMKNMLKASSKRDETKQKINLHISELLERAKSRIPDLQKNVNGVKDGRELNATKRNEFVKEVMSQMTNLYDEMKGLILDDDDKKQAAQLAADGKKSMAKTNDSSSNTNAGVLEAMQAFKNETLSKSQYGTQQNQTDLSDKRSEDAVSVTSQNGEQNEESKGRNFHLNINFTGKKRNKVSKVVHAEEVGKGHDIDPDLLGIRPEQILT